MWFNTFVHAPFSLSQSLSLSLVLHLSCVHPLPPQYSLLPSYPVRCLPFLCTLPVSPGCALITPHGWVSHLFNVQTFPLATCVCFLPLVHELPVLAMLTSLLWASPLLCSPPLCTPVALMLLTPCKHASPRLVHLHELSSPCSSSLTLHGSLTLHHGFSPFLMVTFSTSHICFSHICSSCFMCFFYLRSHTFLPLSHLLPSPLCFSPGWPTLFSLVCSHLAALPVCASLSHACNSPCSCTFSFLQAFKCSLPLSFQCALFFSCFLVHVRSLVSLSCASFSLVFPFCVFLSLLWLFSFLACFPMFQDSPALTCTQILSNAN